jgi:endonuclease/exonuclease/phosphatase family metal-dependent hydrolase
VQIISLNAWGGTMYDPLADWLGTCEADVLCVQEVTRTPNLSGWTRFDDGERSLPQRADLFDDISAALPCHRGRFGASDRGPVRGPDGSIHRQDFGIALFVREDVPILGEDRAFVHGAFVDHDDWPVAERPRIAQAARLRDRQSGRTLAITHLHGLRDPAGKDDTPERRRQARLLVSLIAGTSKPEDLVVVCGDLNLLPGSETFRALGEIGLVDLVGTADTRTSLYNGPVRHANYMLVSEPETVKGFEVQKAPEISDHRPLVLDI